VFFVSLIACLLVATVVVVEPARPPEAHRREEHTHAEAVGLVRRPAARGCSWA
jgi:hypothetical protein